MLDEFVVANRDEIIERARARVASRACPSPTAAEMTHGVPVFLDQLVVALRHARSRNAIDHAQITETAGEHGAELLRIGLTVAQVVHDYGDVCQVVTALAIEQHAPISAAEFRTLNLCLDEAIAEAVTAYSRHRELGIKAKRVERLGTVAHEQRNLLNTVILTFEAIRSGRVAASGSTAQVLVRSLNGLRDLVDRSLTDVRLERELTHVDRIRAAELLEEIEIGAMLQAQARGIRFAVAPVEPDLMVEGDRQLLVAVLSNLLQNAFKFTRKEGRVSLVTHATEERLLFDIQDECGGLPPGKTDDLFRSFEQRGGDRSGLGLGLAISLRAAEANGGTIRVRDLPGEGCVFTLDLPLPPMPPR